MPSNTRELNLLFGLVLFILQLLELSICPALSRVQLLYWFWCFFILQLLELSICPAVQLLFWFWCFFVALVRHELLWWLRRLRDAEQLQELWHHHGHASARHHTRLVGDGDVHCAVAHRLCDAVLHHGRGRQRHDRHQLVRCCRGGTCTTLPIGGYRRTVLVMQISTSLCSWLEFSIPANCVDCLALAGGFRGVCASDGQQSGSGLHKRLCGLVDTL